MEAQAITGVVSKRDEVREMSRYASLLESEFNRVQSQLAAKTRELEATKAVAAGILERTQSEDATRLLVESAASELLAHLEFDWQNLDPRTRLLWENLSRALAGMDKGL